MASMTKSLEQYPSWNLWRVEDIEISTNNRACCLWGETKVNYGMGSPVTTFLWSFIAATLTLELGYHRSRSNSFCWGSEARYIPCRYVVTVWSSSPSSSSELSSHNSLSLPLCSYYICVSWGHCHRVAQQQAISMPGRGWTEATK